MCEQFTDTILFLVTLLGIILFLVTPIFSNTVGLFLVTLLCVDDDDDVDSSEAAGCSAIEQECSGEGRQAADEAQDR